MDTITKIPPEHLSHIFEETTLLDSDSPLKLSLVCRFFNHVATTSPRVWCHLHIALSQSPNSDSSAVQKANLWFGKSRKCHMSLEITGTGRSTGTAAQDALDLLRGKVPKRELGAQLPSVIRREVERVKKLTLRFPTEHQVRCLLRDMYRTVADSYYDGIIEPRENLLRSLTIEVLSPTPRFSLFNPTDPPLSLSHLPNLTQLHLYNCTLDALPLSTFIRVKELTIHNNLRAQPIVLSNLHRILTATHELGELDIEARFTLSAAATLPASSPRLILPHLLTFILRANNIPSILDSIIPPALRTLVLDDLDGNRSDAANELGESLKRLIVRMDMPLAKSPPSISSSSKSSTSVSNASEKSTGLRELTIRNTSFPTLLLPRWVPVWEWCFRRMRSLRKLEAPWTVGDLIAAASGSAGDRDLNARSYAGVDAGTEQDEQDVGYVEGNDGRGPEIVCADLEMVVMPHCPAEGVRRFKSLRPGVEVVVVA